MKNDSVYYLLEALKRLEEAPGSMRRVGRSAGAAVEVENSVASARALVEESRRDLGEALETFMWQISESTKAVDAAMAEFHFASEAVPAAYSGVRRVVLGLKEDAKKISKDLEKYYKQVDRGNLLLSDLRKMVNNAEAAAIDASKMDNYIRDDD